MVWTLAQLAEQTGSRVVGDGEIVIDGVATLEHAQSGKISFLANSKYRRYLEATAASAVILSEADEADCPVAALVSANPYLSYAKIASLLNPITRRPGGVHPSAVVDAQASVHADAWIGPQVVVEAGAAIAAGCQIGPGCVVGENVVLGEDSRLLASVTIYHDVHIGKRALIHAGAVLGSDGFGIANDGGVWTKVPQLGAVSIGDDVEIGANTSIDRGALEDTVIEDGVKLDNQIQVAHNVHIGAHTAIAGCVGISGSARIGRHCMLGGGVGVVGHLEIADHVVVTGMSMVTKSITEAGVYSSGLPAVPNDEWNKTYARLRRLDKLARRVGQLEKLQKRED